MLNFGIIGYGFMGQTHGDMLQKLDYAKIVGVCDINKEQLRDVPADIHTYLKADELLANSDIDTVIIAVPNHIHLEMVKKAANAKKDIILEKPAAMNGPEFQEMMVLTKEANVRFTIHHQRRWDKDYRLIKEVVDSQTLGDIYTIKNCLYGFNGNMHDWHVYPEFGGGMLYDWGVHLIDQMLWMIPGKLKTIYADVRNVINQNVDDYFNIQLYFDSGITGQIELGTYFLEDKEKWFERHWFVGGDKGSAYVDGFEPKGKIVRTSELLANVPGKITMTAAGPTRSFGPPPAGRLVTEDLPDVNVNHQMFFDHYYDYVEGKEELAVKPEEILRLMKVLDAIRISAAEHRSVDFE
ncbi:oxidoreductase [Enterococcus florum]|uniref:Oxidoreductase n=1 Tax=Enterococcus florum TaxID=2480627 RepID=A0A4P5P9W1_9ENTE|nr:Gfo/Idh/MocA family oxidoreductase [Enterococcus florum]GCF94710.1 oxidoreductase [Enterococcus florum]